jgi:hypothetical protein
MRTWLENWMEGDGEARGGKAGQYEEVTARPVDAGGRADDGILDHRDSDVLAVSWRVGRAAQSPSKDEQRRNRR